MQTTSPDPALLLSELVWVRRLALRLTADEAQADDLAQEAFVVAHVHPPRPDQPLRPWLASVVRNLVRMRLRSDGRRTKREQVDSDLNASESVTTVLKRSFAIKPRPSTRSTPSNWRNFTSAPYSHPASLFIQTSCIIGNPPMSRADC